MRWRRRCFLPALDAVGYSAAAGAANSAEALQLLTWLYALVPCILKLGAMALLTVTAVARAAAGRGVTPET